MATRNGSTTAAHATLSQWYEARARVLSVLETGRIRMVFQPIVDLNDMREIGVEALARFHAEPVRSPDQWFDEARRVGHGARLEFAAMRVALRALATLSPRRSLFLNASADTLLDPDMIGLLRGFDPRRLVIEITVHTPLSDHGAVRDAVDVLRGFGVRIALDDWGAGHTSLGQVFALHPDILKLHVSLTRTIAVDPLRRAAAASLAALGAEAGIAIVAEGIESRAQLDVIRSVGIPLGQGDFLAAPGSLPSGAGPLR